MDEQLVKKAVALRALAESQAAALAAAPPKAVATIETVRDLAYLVSQLTVLTEAMVTSG